MEWGIVYSEIYRRTVNFYRISEEHVTSIFRTEDWAYGDLYECDYEDYCFLECDTLYFQIS
jgi:hypothetical protein